MSILRDSIVLMSLAGAGCGAKASPVPTRPIAPAAAQESGPLAPESLLAEVEHLCSDKFAGRGSYQEGGGLAAQFVYDEFRKLGFEVHRQPVRGRHAENIIAIKKGDDPKEREYAVIVSAHHDHLGKLSGRLYRGADDNASGLAVLLGIARSQAHKKHKHTIIFASFGAEEDGLIGSGVYVRNPIWELEKTVMVLNFDMVGRNFYEAGANQRDAVAVVGLEDSPVAQAAAKKAATSLGLHLIAVPARVLELFNLHDRTDDWWFRRQERPAIHFSTGLHRDYHEITDTPDKIVPEQLSRIAALAVAVLESLTTPIE